MFQKRAIRFMPLIGVVLLAFELRAQEFSAEVIVKNPDGTVEKGKIYQTANRYRFDSSLEQKPGGVTETRMIIDREQKLIYVVEPQKKLILVNYALRTADNGTDNSCADLLKTSVSMIPRKGASGCRQVGSENVNGRSTMKWEMHLAVGKIQLGTWTVWMDSQVKTATQWQSSDGSSGHLENIQTGPQSASLFVLPADYRRQDLPH